MRLRPPSCERACEYVSLDLDGELSPFGRALLERHVQRCPSCAEYARVVAGATELLRATPVEEFRLPDLKLRTRRLGRILSGVAATAAVAAVAAWLGVASTQSPRAPSTSVSLPHGIGAIDPRRDWPAGLPSSAKLVQLAPGGLQTVDVEP
jgi:anti-sigma factor RsiW